jgi:hypothetical protein
MCQKILMTSLHVSLVNNIASLETANVTDALTYPIYAYICGEFLRSLRWYTKLPAKLPKNSS